MKFFRNHRRSVVDQVGDQAGQANKLAGIKDQKLLGDPRTNPATRPHADRLRDDQQREALDLEHRRAVRRGRVSDRRAAHAERTLQAIQDAKEVVSPARAVTSLQRGRTRFLGAALVASLLLSAGSALGLAAVSVHTGGLAAAGWIAELCLTTATTGAILYRSHVDQANTADDPASPIWSGWRHPVLVVLVIAPLTTSVLINFGGWVAGAPVSPVNALCAVGAGVAAVFAYLIADVSSRAVRVNARAVDTADEEELRREAVGEDLFTPVEAPESSDQNDTGHDVADGVADPDPDGWLFDGEASWIEEVEEFVHRHDPPENSATPSRPNDSGDGPQGAAKPLPQAGSHTDPDDHHIDDDQGFDGLPDRDGGESTERVIPATQARKLKGLHTRWRVAEHITTHPDHTVAQIAAALDLGETTVRRHLKALEDDDGSGEG